MGSDLFNESVAVWRDPERCIPFVKGRVALYAILRALGIGEGSEVLIPGFTCVVVPAAVVYAGATPVFYDIDPVSLQGDPALAVAAISDRTKAVLIQHNFGTIAPTDLLVEHCRARDIAVIEDCAHAMGAYRDAMPAGTLGTAAFCSLQWSKPTTTGLGGIARFNDDALAQAGRHLARTEFSEPLRLKSIYLGILSSLFRYWYRPSWYWTAQNLYRWAGRHGFVQGSSSEQELVSSEMPVDYCERFGALRTGSLTAALDGLPILLRHRRRISALYAERLAELDVWLPPRDFPNAKGAALRFPLLVENRDDLLQRARQERIELGDWFNAPLHPRGARPEIFGYHPSCCPYGEAAAARVINLPSHRHVNEREVDRILRFIAEYGCLTPPENWCEHFSGPPSEPSPGQR